MFEVMVQSYFSAAHNISDCGGKCEALHGHNWKVQVFVMSKDIEETGMVIDFALVKDYLKQVLELVDHKYLNEVPPFDTLNPTSENIARYIFEKLSSKLDKKKCSLKKVSVWETDTSRASYIS